MPELTEVCITECIEFMSDDCNQLIVRRFMIMADKECILPETATTLYNKDWIAHIKCLYVDHTKGLLSSLLLVGEG